MTTITPTAESHVVEQHREPCAAGALLIAVIDELRALGRGDHANQSRDFGRGVAFAVTRLTDVLTTGMQESP